MRDILKNILYKSTQNTDEELLFKMNITGDTPEEKRSDGVPLESENTLKLPLSLKEESDFPSSSTASTSQTPPPIYYSQEKLNTQAKEKARKEVYSKLLTHVKEYMKDDGLKFDKSEKIALFKERDFKAYIFPLEKDFLFGYQYHHVELIPSDKTHFTPHMTRHFNVYVKRDKQTPAENLKNFEDQLRISATR